WWVRYVKKFTIVLFTLLLVSCFEDRPEIKRYDLKTFKDCEKCPEMVVLPKGEYLMGDGEDYKYKHETRGPQQKININYHLAVGVFEVTDSEYRECVLDRQCEDVIGFSANRSFEKLKPSNSVFPRDEITWERAHKYIAWLSDLTGREYRLPSESEWEYAARGGTETEFWWGSDDKANDHRYAWTKDSGGRVNGQTAKSFFPNPYGLIAMNGNLSEWVQDCYYPNLEGMPNDGSPRLGNDGIGECDYATSRGGDLV
ncbi:MAG: SUMF1/EgtB/PvdO family nonheme iron enzyme, partial [Emcibacteraceae bacterium]|nr:SUMF1/EgtB/PvdO family nonheme iron enzyme [Emcibacteraceae bacterium]